MSRTPVRASTKTSPRFAAGFFVWRRRLRRHECRRHMYRRFSNRQGPSLRSDQSGPPGTRPSGSRPSEGQVIRIPNQSPIGRTSYTSPHLFRVESGPRVTWPSGCRIIGGTSSGSPTIHRRAGCVEQKIAEAAENENAASRRFSNRQGPSLRSDQSGPPGTRPSGSGQSDGRVIRVPIYSDPFNQGFV